MVNNLCFSSNCDHHVVNNLCLLSNCNHRVSGIFSNHWLIQSPNSGSGPLSTEPQWALAAHTVHWEWGRRPTPRADSSASRARGPHCPLGVGLEAHAQSGFLCLKAIFSAALRVKSSQHAFVYTMRLSNSAVHILPRPSLAFLSDSYGFWIFWEHLEVILRFIAFHCIHCPLGVGPEAHTVH